MKRKFADSLCLIIVLCLGCSLDLEHQQPDELGGDASLRRMPFLPNAYMRVTQGANGSYSHQGSISEAIDWSSPDFEDRGMAVTAMQSGTIVNIVKGLPDSCSSGFGNLVEVLTSEGDVDRLAHCREVIVRPGEAVKQGQVLCTLGTSGNSTGTHVHSDRRRSGTSQTLELNFFESGGVPREGRNYSSRNTGPYDRSYWEHGGPSMLGEPSEEASWYFDYVPCNDTVGERLAGAQLLTMLCAAQETPSLSMASSTIGGWLTLARVQNSACQSAKSTLTRPATRARTEQEDI